MLDVSAAFILFNVGRRVSGVAGEQANVGGNR